ncbi:dipeptidyl-peptidase III [Choiromyces venosus 120613-1]|uniref:Dipeptidyl peptidase 3 n=1 Tax=Choiromyces venosus 120613-1 TaxID=1336337 RepID=A0A3N4JCV5_9PEZI|nr:dipeptidyl-peptidase III [Choiromyces venosus 120613-1]
MADSTSIPSHLLADSPPTICRLEIAPHFAALTPKEKLYAHHISRASFLGTRVTLRQHSPESEAIYDLILALYAACSGDWKKLVAESSVSEQHVQYWLEYATVFLASLGNYKSFGDLKFVPRIPKAELRKLATSAGPEAKGWFEKVEEVVYSVVPEEKNLIGYIDAGHVSAYYPDSPSITQAEIEEVQAVTADNGILVENTRLKKVSDVEFHLLFASVDTTAPEGQDTEYAFGEDGKKKLKLVYGDYAELMKKISAECRAAAEYSANEVQRGMWGEYARSFDIGSIQAHKESQKYWVQDRGPRVEANIGFVETYRDPAGVRAEWEGFAAMVNEERTRAFGELVRRAEDFITRLPWSRGYEKDHFLKPDFTSLEVLTFAGAGIPAGINIPNYDDIRQEIGFKNVSLGNVLSAKSPNEKITFLKPEDVALYSKLQGPAFEVQVGVHELLGHGTGKLLQETSPGEYNFDHTNPPLNPITNEPVKTWYKPNETWGSVFGGLAASYEECRAELVAMYLGVEKDLLSIFGHASDAEAEDVLYIEYLQMARAGLLSVETWDPKSQKWGQAHSQARYFILQVFISAGDNFVTFSHSLPDKSDLTISIDHSKILSHGRKAVGEFLTKLHIYKSTADVEAGSELYKRMTEVTEEFRGYREVVMKLKQPRKVFVQANTVLTGEGVVELREYEVSVEGMVKSYAERGV